MAETGHDAVSSAALRFYAAQRFARTAEVSVEPMLRSEVVHYDVSDRSDTVQATLEAFMNSREEDAVSFLASFLQLTPDDRVTALARLESHEETPCAAGAAAGNERSDASRQATTFEELRQRLQHHEVRAKQLALTERHTEDVLLRRVDLPSLRIHQRPRQKGQRLLDGATPAVTAPLQCRAACSGEEEGLETIELEEGTRTSNLLAFVDTGLMEVSTNFDNFFDTVAVPQAATGGLQDEACDSLRLLPAQGAPPTLDSILGLDAEEVEGPATPPPEQLHRAPMRAASETGVKLMVPAKRSPSRRESGTSSLTTSMGSVALPGLEDASEKAASPEEASRDTCSTDILAKIHEVMAEADNCVEAFALDPLFDYDVDLLGEAFRAGTRWRQE